MKLKASRYSPLIRARVSIKPRRGEPAPNQWLPRATSSMKLPKPQNSKGLRRLKRLCSHSPQPSPKKRSRDQPAASRWRRERGLVSKVLASSSQSSRSPGPGRPSRSHQPLAGGPAGPASAGNHCTSLWRRLNRSMRSRRAGRCCRLLRTTNKSPSSSKAASVPSGRRALANTPAVSSWGSMIASPGSRACSCRSSWLLPFALERTTSWALGFKSRTCRAASRFTPLSWLSSSTARAWLTPASSNTFGWRMSPSTSLDSSRWPRSPSAHTGGLWSRQRMGRSNPIRLAKQAWPSPPRPHTRISPGGVSGQDSMGAAIY